MFLNNLKPAENSSKNGRKTFTQLSRLSIHLFKNDNRNLRKGCEVCSKLTIKTPERRH